MVRDEQIVGLCGETKIAKKRQRPSRRRCRAIMSSSFLAFFTQIHLSFEYCIFTTWLKLLSSCLVVLFVYLAVSIRIVSKHQKAILMTGFPSSRILTLWSAILRILSITFTRKISFLVWWRSISLLSCWRHFPSVRMCYVFCLQNYCPGYLPRVSFSVRSLDYPHLSYEWMFFSFATDN